MVMIEGWLLDVHENETNTGMVAWIVDDFGTAHGCTLPWKPTIHVHASHHFLDRLEHWLAQPELRQRFGIGSLLTIQARLNLEAEGHVDVLSIPLCSYQHMRALAEHIEARGDFHRFKLYSVDAHLAQRFLNDHGCMPFQRVRWSSSDPARLQPVDGASSAGDVFPPFHVVRLIVEFTPGGFPAHGDTVERIRLDTVHEPGLSPPQATHSYTVERRDFDSLAGMLTAFQTVFESVDPDVVLTAGGDQHWFPWFVEQAKVQMICKCCVNCLYLFFCMYMELLVNFTKNKNIPKTLTN